MYTKARQSSKIKELGEALIASGFRTLDQQAKVLGLSRSTTWTLLKANHKSSGLSATIITRVLMAPQLPPPVRAKILEYVEEKAAGLYGHNSTQRRRFIAHLSVAPITLRAVSNIVRLRAPLTDISAAPRPAYKRFGTTRA